MSSRVGTGVNTKDVNEVGNESQPDQKYYPAPGSLSDNYLPYFRHKGIKIRFADIEQVLNGYELVHEAVVMLREDLEGKKTLVAFIVPNGVFNEQSVSNYLQEKVAEYMVPKIWIPVKNIPLTENGEIDRNALNELSVKEPAGQENIAPRNEIETKLLTVIQNILAINSLSIQDNFFRVGGGSLQALQVIAALRKELGVKLDIKIFFLYPTIAQLADYLQKIAVTDQFANSGTKEAEAFDTATQKAIFKKSIVPLKPRGSKLPLYIVSGGGGTAFTFEKFAYMLDVDQPVYIFQSSSDIRELEKFPDTIEGIAAKYVDELLEIDSSETFALSGHCIGGVIALEMARKLQGMGKKIKLLAMFDVILSENIKPAPITFKNLYKIPELIRKAISKVYLKINFETFLFTRHPRDTIKYKVNTLKSLANKIFHFQQEDEELIAFKKFEQKFKTAFDNYQVKKYDGDMLVFYAKDHFYFLDKNKNIQFKKFPLNEEIKVRWKDYAKSVAFYEVEGEHSTIFFSQEFAGILQQHL